jgi:hypothetical protein
LGRQLYHHFKAGRSVNAAVVRMPAGDDHQVQLNREVTAYVISDVVGLDPELVARYRARPHRLVLRPRQKTGQGNFAGGVDACGSGGL